MIMIITVGVFAVALGLISTGLYFHIKRRELESDPLLISSCYMSGSVLLLGNILLPML